MHSMHPELQVNPQKVKHVHYKSTPFETHIQGLWCVFELAAYRKANPSGTIVLAPLFIEMAIGCVLLGTYAVVFVFWISQSMNVNLPLTYTGYVLSLVPAYFAFHVLRTSTREKLKLITDLKAFDLEGADCRSDYDRDFIFAGITAWYGSKTAFADYVRGPLFDELVRPLSKNQVPNVYWCLLLTPTIGSGLEPWIDYLFLRPYPFFKGGVGHESRSFLLRVVMASTLVSCF